MTGSTRRTLSLLALSIAPALAACGSGTAPSSPAATTPPAASSKTVVTRGAITARSAGSMTVNGVILSTGSAAVRADGKTVAESALAKGMVVTVRGSFDDRSGEAAEVETEHALEGAVDDKGVDFVVIGGARVHLDDATEFTASRPGRLADVAVGDLIAVSGVADDRGGLHASRVDDSARAAGPASVHDDLDLQGFVSNVVAGASFELRLTPDAAERWVVLTSGLTLPAGFRSGARVEVHSLSAPAPGTAPVLGTVTASSVELEDSLDAPDEQGELELEGIVTSGAAGLFVVDGVTVQTSAATAWNLGVSTDLVPGVEVEVEGLVDASDVLQASKVSFRPGARVVATLQGVTWDGTSGTATILGLPVQLPSFARYDVAPAEGRRVELRANPSASGAGLVALRLSDASSSGGNVDRVFVRAVVTARSNANAAAPGFTILGFAVSSAGASFHGPAGEVLTADAFFAAVEPGRTVVKARAARATDVTATTFAADELEIEGNE